MQNPREKQVEFCLSQGLSQAVSFTCNKVHSNQAITLPDQSSTYSEHNIMIMLGKVVVAVQEPLWEELSRIWEHIWVVGDEV